MLKDLTTIPKYLNLQNIYFFIIILFFNIKINKILQNNKKKTIIEVE